MSDSETKKRELEKEETEKKGTGEKGTGEKGIGEKGIGEKEMEKKETEKKGTEKKETDNLNVYKPRRIRVKWSENEIKDLEAACLKVWSLLLVRCFKIGLTFTEVNI